MLQAGDPPPEEAPDGVERPGRARGVDGAAHVAAAGERAAERLAMFDASIAEIAARVEPAYRQADGWLEQTRAGLLELLCFCEERPETARAVVIDSIAWGPEVLARRSRLLEELAGVLDRGCEQLGPAAALPPETAVSLVGASLSWVQTRLVSGEGSFVEFAPSLMSMIAHPYLGAEAARHELRRSLAYAGERSAERESEGLVEAARETSY